MGRKLFRGFCDRDDRILEKVSPTVFRIRCHGIRRLLAEQMVKTPRQQGRSEREAEAYFHLYVEV